MVFIILYRDSHKSQNSEILGVYEKRIDAIRFLISYLTDNHNSSRCDNRVDCEWCDIAKQFNTDLLKNNIANIEYEIHEIEMNQPISN